jgi:hypothetical protein
MPPPPIRRAYQRLETDDEYSARTGSLFRNLTHIGVTSWHVGIALREGKVSLATAADAESGIRRRTEGFDPPIPQLAALETVALALCPPRRMVWVYPP